MSFKFIAVLTLLTIWSLPSRADLCIASDRYCKSSGGSARSTTEPAYPNTQTSLDLNPAAVPLSDQWGLEGIFYKGFPDLVVVHGNGRVGAAISPSNGEDTFFGNPSFETTKEYLEREQNSDKYKSKKLAFGLAGALYDNGENDLTHLELSVGALLRYNELTHSVKPGGGLSGIAGPLTLGVSTSLDETQLTDDTTMSTSVVKDKTLMYSVGLALKTGALDYSVLTLTPNVGSVVKVQLITGSILLERWILTAAYRIENSDRPAYQSSTNSLIAQRVKKNYFGGAQFAAFSHVQIGLFYDYYLLHEISAGLTIFL